MYDPNWVQDGRDILEVLKAAGAGFLARHTSVEGQNAVESIKKAIEYKGFSLVQITYQCITNFAGKALGTRKAVEAYRWLKERTNPDDPGKIEGITYKTGVYHYNEKNRPEFSESMRGYTKDIVLNKGQRSTL